MPTVSIVGPGGGGCVPEKGLPPHDTKVSHPPVPSEGFSDSDEVFPKEMTKWNSSDFIDAFASPTEAEGAPGTGPDSGCQHRTCSGDSENKSVLV